MSANQGYYDSNQALDPEGRKYGFSNTGTATVGSAMWSADNARRTKRSKMMVRPVYETFSGGCDFDAG